MALHLPTHAGCTENDIPKLAKTGEPPECSFSSSVFEPLYSFKSVEIKYVIILAVRFNHPKVLS